MKAELSTQPITQRRPVRLGDWAMLALALFSIALLCWQTWGHISAEQSAWVQRADYFICLIFAVEFALRWRLDDWRWRFVARNWYEVLGMLPVSYPAVRSFRLLRIVRVLILFGRFGRAGDRAFGSQFTYQLVNQVSDRLVNEVSGAVTVAVLDRVSEVLQKGHYSRNIAAALAENHDELHHLLLDKLEADPKLKNLKRLPFYGDLSSAMVEAGLRVVAGTLDDPRTDEFISDLLRENLAQIRQAVAAQEAVRKAPASG